MDHYKTVVVPAAPKTTKQEIYKTTCDLCSSEIVHEVYSAEDVKIRYRTGSLYPEGGSGDETTVDMCSECFNGKLVPWLKSIGANPITKDWDW